MKPAVYTDPADRPIEDRGLIDDSMDADFDRRCDEAEAEARREKRGIWADSEPDTGKH